MKTPNRRPILLLATLLSAVLPACTPRVGGVPRQTPPATPSHFVLDGGRLPDGRVTAIEIRDGIIVGLGAVHADVPHISVAGRWIVPAFIDSHVHLAYLPVADALADGGVAGAVDLASPLSFLSAPHAPVQIVAAGPMITAPGGYPTRTWGRNGYGMECATPEQARAAVDLLAEHGARVVKIPLAAGPHLSDDALRAAVDRAHADGLKVAVHALTDADAAQAARAGADILAHTPVAALSDATIAAWSHGTVITTLAAFGGSRQTVQNLAALRKAGTTVLYGTDLGNGRNPGIHRFEIDLMMQAGMDAYAIVAAGTSTPASFWGFDNLGRIEVGHAASLLVLRADPATDPDTLAAPEAVYIDGRRR